MIKEQKYSFISKEEGRVDRVICTELSISRGIFDGEYSIIINNKKSKKGDKVKVGDSIIVTYKEELYDGIKGENIPLDIIYEDEDVLVINKEQGMVVHPGDGNREGTLVNALLFRYGSFFDSDILRPGIVHRLDKDTSGVMIVAKNAQSHEVLGKEFENREVIKYYIAIAKGHFNESQGIIEKRICRDRNNRKKFTVTDRKTHSKDAKTVFMVISQNDNYAFLLLRLYTGRTHQIRVHLQSINHPILGDEIYSRPDAKYKDESLMLNSYSLSFLHPKTNERVRFLSPMPERFISFCKKEDLTIPETLSEITL